MIKQSFNLSYYLSPEKIDKVVNDTCFNVQLKSKREWGKDCGSNVSELWGPHLE